MLSKFWLTGEKVENIITFRMKMKKIWVVMLLFLSCGEERFCKRRSDYGRLLPDCQDYHRPIIFIHGMFGGYDNFSNMVQRFIQNGYCPEKLIEFEYNTLDFLHFPSVVRRLEETVRRVLRETGFDRVDLIGHSLGGFVGFLFLNSMDNASMVAHYVHAASSGNLEFPEDVKILNLSSRADTAVGLTYIPGAINVEIEGADHMQIVSSEDSFREVYRFFNDGEEPGELEIFPEDHPRIEGKVMTLAENFPLEDILIKVYPVSRETGERLTEAPLACFITDKEGKWGVFTAEKGMYYEFHLEGKALITSLHYYRQPFLGTRNSDRFRTLPEKGGFLEPIISPLLKFSDDSGITVLFTANQGIYEGRDLAFINQTDISTSYYADPSHTSLAYFFADFNGNRKSDLTKGPLSVFPFFLDVDYFIPTDRRTPIRFELNGKSISLPNWKPLSEGVGIAVFEY